MTKEELREKRNLAIENLNHAIAILGSDELYIDELEQKNAELKSGCGMCYRKDRENLTKAKELLKEYYSLTYGETMTGLRGRTEKFLNSEEVER